MANVQKKNARGHRREEKKAAARGTAPAPKKRTKAEQARWEQMELEAQAAAAKRQENISRIVGVAIFALSVIFFFVAVIGGDGAWKVVHNVYLGLFGMLAAVLFPILAVAIILLYSYKENKAKKRAMEEAGESLKKVQESISLGMPEDFYSIDLMDVYESLGSITGESVGEDLVNEIFSKFCMGK